MNEPPEALLLCLIATMAYFHCCGARGRIFHCSFCSAQRLRPYDCNALGRRKLVGVSLGRKAGGAFQSGSALQLWLQKDIPTYFERNRIISLWLKDETDTSACLQKRAAADDRTKSIANTERLSPSRAGFGPILSKNYVVTHGS